MVRQPVAGAGFEGWVFKKKFDNQMANFFLTTKWKGLKLMRTEDYKPWR